MSINPHNHVKWTVTFHQHILMINFDKSNHSVNQGITHNNIVHHFLNELNVVKYYDERGKQRC